MDNDKLDNNIVTSIVWIVRVSFNYTQYIMIYT